MDILDIITILKLNSGNNKRIHFLNTKRMLYYYISLISIIVKCKINIPTKLDFEM